MAMESQLCQGDHGWPTPKTKPDYESSQLVVDHNNNNIYAAKRCGVCNGVIKLTKVS